MSTLNQTNSSSRYILGIDLGTTNCAVAYFDTLHPHQSIQLFRIPQVSKHGHEEIAPLLPSALFLEESSSPSVGMQAKWAGLETPTRLIQSAKSWLSNPAAHRREKILPFGAEGIQKLSPVEASAQLLKYIAAMWDRQMAKKDPAAEIGEQEIILTVPASFDEVARLLTLEAAKMAGLKKITLLEEPQAAFYHWLMHHGTKSLSAQETILVCDVGGGTTDFTWIDVVEDEKGVLELRRMAVGKHLLLGGDNMDAALCHHLAGHLELNSAQYLSLLQQVRLAKEHLLSSPDKKEYPIFIAGKGSSVVGGSMSLKVTGEMIEKVLVEGFLGLYEFEEAVSLNKGSGIRQMGLPYESEPSITKHLAHFLKTNNRSQQKPDYILFNGGTMKPELFQSRIIDSLERWYGPKPIRVLSSISLDLAVAFGAAYYGKLRLQKEAIIKGGIPRSYYIKIESQEGEGRALTLLPRGSEEGVRAISDNTLWLLPNQPVFFQLFHSTTRLDDKAGDIILIEEEELTPLPPIQTICQYGKKDSKEPLPVRLEIYLTAIGILELWLLSQQSEHRWKLEFQIRGLAHEETWLEKRLIDQTYDAHFLEPPKEAIVEAFAVGSPSKLKGLTATLEKLLGQDKRDWSPSILRALFEPLLEQAAKRLLSVQYESRFWNLAGFFLRPGLGYPLDDFRIKQLWKLILADQKRTKPEEIDLQHWICYRRIAAGLNKGQQIQLFTEISQHKGKKNGYCYAEHLRALASLELIDHSFKIKLGNTLLKKIGAGKGEPADYWALGRLGARHLFYGTMANVLPPSVAEEWIRALLSAPAHEHLSFTLAMLARKTGYREIDISASVLEQIAPLMIAQQDLLFSDRDLTQQEQERFFGDSLPSGLRVCSPISNM